MASTETTPTPTTKALKAVGASRMFGLLPLAAQTRLADAGQPVALERGSLLFQKGDEGDAAFIVLDGDLEVRTLSSEGKELRIASHRAGALIGEMAVLDGAPRSADVVAARRSSLWRLPRASVLEVLHDHPHAAIALLAELAGRLRAANAQLELTARRDLEAHLAALLVAERNRRNHVAMTQTEMARRIGFSREKVNRRLNLWARAGWLSIEKSGVLLLRPEPLEQLVP